jgi:hypothetical protein
MILGSQKSDHPNMVIIHWIPSLTKFSDEREGGGAPTSATPLWIRQCTMKWLIYQRVISLESQVGVTSQINKWANTDPRTCQRWDQVPRSSKHSLLTGRTRLEPIPNAKIISQNQCVQNVRTKQPAAKSSESSQVKFKKNPQSKSVSRSCKWSYP